MDTLDDVDIDDDVDTELEVDTLKGMKSDSLRKIEKCLKNFSTDKPDILKGNNSVTSANKCNIQIF